MGTSGAPGNRFTSLDAGRRKRVALLVLQAVQRVAEPDHGALERAPLVVRRRAAVDDLRDEPQRLVDLAFRREEREAPFEPGAAIAVAAPLGAGALAANRAA